MRPNVIRDDELYLRCIFCGDSQNPNHAHLTINMTTGLYHCFRCHAGGKVTSSLLLSLQLKDHPQLDFQTSQPMPEVIRGPGSQRYSALSRYHSATGGDIFFSWWRENHVGYYLKEASSKKLWGFSGVNWSSAPDPVYSSPEHPLRFVEGPYDVLGKKDICFFGIPSVTKIKSLYREHFFTLVPDGDLWTSQARFQILKNLIDYLVNHQYGFTGVEFLPKGMDPDERPESKFIPSEFFKEKIWRSTSQSLRAQRALASLR